MCARVHGVLGTDRRIVWCLRRSGLQVPSFVGLSVVGSEKYVLVCLDSLAWFYRFGRDWFNFLIEDINVGCV